MNRLALFLIFAAACGTQELLTRDMYAGMGVSNDGTNTTVSADFLSVRQLTWVELSGGDSLVASVGSFEQGMPQTQFGPAFVYSAKFPGGRGGDTFTIDLRRTVDGGAPASSATLPAEFEIDALTATQSRAQTMTISWSNVSSDLVQWQIYGSCIEFAGGDADADADAFMLPAGSLRKLDGQPLDACDATLRISRIRPGSLDAAFGNKGGGITAEQIRTATFTTTP